MRRCVAERHFSDLKKLQAAQVGPEYHRELQPELKGCIKEMVGADIYKLYYVQMSHVSSGKDVNAKVKSRLGTTGFIHNANFANLNINQLEH